MPKEKKIEFEVLQEFMNTQKVLFARTDTKMMEFNLSGGIQIFTKDRGTSWLSRQKVWEGVQPYVALETYNDLP